MKLVWRDLTRGKSSEILHNFDVYGLIVQKTGVCGVISTSYYQWNDTMLLKIAGIQPYLALECLRVSTCVMARNLSRFLSFSFDLDILMKFIEQLQIFANYNKMPCLINNSRCWENLLQFSQMAFDDGLDICASLQAFGGCVIASEFIVMD